MADCAPLRLVSEAEDYRSVVEYYIDLLTSSTIKTIDILLCGNSAGSLAATQCRIPPIAGRELRIGYILISYPLSVIWALSLFRSSTFQAALEGIAADPELHLLSIRGDSDQFTGDAKYASWEDSLVGSQQGNVCCCRLENTDHFFLHVESLKRLLAAVDDWLTSRGK